MACGTGGWAGPLPGDPSNASGLTATPAFGGIELAWNYPDVNPQAVAYTLIYKSTLPQFETAIEFKKVGGNYYFDRIDVEQGLGPYSYWVQPFSVNGTPGEVIGPATATARATIEQTIRDLTGMIDAGFLAQSLKTEIDRIELLDTNLAQEILDRLAANQAFSNLLNTLRDDADAALTLIQNLQSQQVTDNTAQATSLNLLAAALNGNIAALATEQTVRATADTALSNQITVLTASVNGNTAAIATEATARVNGDNALATLITEVQAETDGFSAALATEVDARTSADSALASQVATIQATLNGLNGGDLTEAQALVEVEAAARVAGDAALASQITTAQSTLNGQISSVQTTLQTQITSNANGVTALGALWTAKVQVNGLIGGFGVYNNGVEVQAGFDVDTFWIGRTGSDLKKPFIVSGGEVFINKAVIQQITADMIDGRGLVIRNADGSPAFASGTYIEITDARHRGSVNLAPTYLWKNGQAVSGGGTSMVTVAGHWNSNGSSAGTPTSHHIGWDYGPYGTTMLVWRSTSGSEYGAQGGYANMASSNPIDRQKAYRVAQWVRFTGNMSGSFYLGCAGSQVVDLPSGAVNTNPYMVVVGRSGFVPGRWYLAVGYIHPAGYSSQLQLSGIYDGVTGQKVFNGTDFAWTGSATEGGWRSYQYYTTATGAITDFGPPLVSVIDGSEASIEELLSKTSISGRNPITPSNASTYIQDAWIGQAVVDGWLQSTNYVPNVSGWRINKNGNAEFANVKVRGDVQATSLNGQIIGTSHIVPGAVVDASTGELPSPLLASVAGTWYTLTTLPALSIPDSAKVVLQISMLVDPSTGLVSTGGGGFTTRSYRPLFRVLRNGVQIGNTFSMQARTMLDVPPAGAHVYTLQFQDTISGVSSIQTRAQAQEAVFVALAAKR